MLASQVYALLYRVPGIGLAKENNLESYMVANVVFFMGLFTFAIFLGKSERERPFFSSVEKLKLCERLCGKVAQKC